MCDAQWRYALENIVFGNYFEGYLKIWRNYLLKSILCRFYSLIPELFQILFSRTRSLLDFLNSSFAKRCFELQINIYYRIWLSNKFCKCMFNPKSYVLFSTYWVIVLTPLLLSSIQVFSESEKAFGEVWLRSGVSLG